MMKRLPSALLVLPILMLVLGLIAPLAMTSVSAEEGTAVAVEEALPPDVDGDGVADGGDNCPVAANPEQEDTDADSRGDACDDTPFGDPTPVSDVDGDGFPDETDNCTVAANPDQTDTDGDGAGDACDETPAGPDADLDGVLDGADNCPNYPGSDQADSDGDGTGDICDETPNPTPEPEPEKVQAEGETSEL